MLKREQRFFLSVLADYLNRRETTPVTELDWKALYDLASRHSLSAIFYAQCGAFLPPEAELPFLQDYGHTVADYAAWQKIAAEIEREFTRRKISFVVVKGPVIAACYPQPELRTMGDLDIVVRPVDKEKAHGVLLEMGFRSTSKESNEWAYWKGKYEIELHHRLLYDDSLAFASSLHLTDKLWEHVRPVNGSSRCELESEFHFLFLATHLQKHLAYYGAGFRQFMDLAVAAQTWLLDWKKLNTYLEEMGARAFMETAMTLCSRWFQLMLPHANRDLPLKFEQELCQQLFQNGTFGFDNKANQENLFINKVNAAGDDTLGVRIGLLCNVLKQRPALKHGLWRALFPGYDDLRGNRSYRFINHRPWLLPAAWLYRYLHCFWFKVTQGCLILLFSRRRIQEHNDSWKTLGLLKQNEKS